MGKIGKPCLNCGNISTTGSRCEPCQARWNKQHPKPFRPHYSGNYRKRAKEVRDNATICWLCGQGEKPNDIWTADHIIPGDPDSPLLPAHRSCNSSRGNLQR